MCRMILPWVVFTALYHESTAFSVTQHGLKQSTRFHPATQRRLVAGPRPRRHRSLCLDSSRDPQVMFTEERRAELFQFLLRDLQVEGVPILTVDTTASDSIPWSATLQAALWTTLSTLYASSSTEPKGDTKLCCLVFEDVPLASLQSLVDGFGAQSQTMATWPEVSLFQLSLLGNGMGPAIVISQSAHSSVPLGTVCDTSDNDPATLDAMQHFVERMASSETSHALYRTCHFGDVYHIMTSFWNSICELVTCHDDTTDLFLLLPRASDGVQWRALLSLQQWSFGLYSPTNLEMQSYHPDHECTWDESDATRLAQFTKRIGLVDTNNLDENTARLLTDRLVAMVDTELSQRMVYLRRSPIPAIRFQLNPGEDPQARHCDRVFFQSLAHLMATNVTTLQSELDTEMKRLKPA